MAPYGSYLAREIMAQPTVLERLLAEEQAIVSEVAAAIRRQSPSYVLLAARGSSDNAARYGKYLFGAANGLPVALATPSLFTRYQSPPRLDHALVMGISQSGQSPDIVSVVKESRRQGALTVAITNDRASPLAQAAAHTVWLRSEEEQSLAATKTYTASLMALAMLSAALNDDNAPAESLTQVPNWITCVLADAEEIVEAAERYRYMEACVVIGRGYNYATAFEIALKLKELTYVLAEPYSSADFRHGPVALVERGFPVIGVVPQGAVAGELDEMIRTLRQREAEIVGISNVSDVLGKSQTALAIPDDVPEWVSPMVSVVPGQLFALGLTVAKGLDPDHPRGLRKVTLTR